jgi:RHS repeat-associated protein
VTSFGYDLANRLWSMGATTYANDAFGARTAKIGGDSWQYIYDGESRLTRVAKNGATQVDCVYDGNGMRVKKVEGGKTTYYVYSGANPLLEYSPTDGTYLYRIYTGKKAVAEEKAGVVKFYHKDHLGSTRVVTNAAGVKIAEYKFAPYGEKETAVGDGTEYQFTDKQSDATTGLSYHGHRYLDPEVGRWLTVDPKKDGTNWFAYCRNNPLRFFDPNGLESREARFSITFPTNAFAIAGDVDETSGRGIGLPTGCPGEVTVSGTMTVVTEGKNVNVDVVVGASYESKSPMETGIAMAGVVNGTVSVWDNNGGYGKGSSVGRNNIDTIITKGSMPGFADKTIHNEFTYVASQSIVDKSAHILTISLTINVEGVVIEGFGIPSPSQSELVADINVNEPGGGDSSDVSQSDTGYEL